MVSREPIPPKSVYDEKIERLENKLGLNNTRLVACRDTTGTYADYLRKRIKGLGMELARTRKERHEYYGSPTESGNHRISGII